MTDLAEAVVRGEILVDEIDIIEAVEKGRLSESDGARFSAVLEEYSKLHGKNPEKKAEGSTPATELPSTSTKWDEVLVDEMDFLKAMKTGRIKKDDSHIASINKENIEDLSGDVDEAKISFHESELSDLIEDDMSESSSSVDILI